MGEEGLAFVSRRRGRGVRRQVMPSCWESPEALQGPGVHSRTVSTDLEAKGRAGSPEARYRPYWSTSWFKTGVYPRRGLQEGLRVTLRPPGTDGESSSLGLPDAPARLYNSGLPQGRGPPSSPRPAGTPQEQMKLSLKPLPHLEFVVKSIFPTEDGICTCGDRVRTNSGRLVFLDNLLYVVFPLSSPANIGPISKTQLEPHSLGRAFGPRRPRALPNPELEQCQGWKGSVPVRCALAALGTGGC